MRLKIERGTLIFFGGLLVLYLVVQGLSMLDVLGDFWITILRLGAAMSIVVLGLNLIYGFNGQFSLGQWGFYGIGAYAAADITYRWYQQHSASGLTVMFFVVAFIALAILGVGWALSRVKGLDILSAFGLYIAAVILAGYLAGRVGMALTPTITSVLAALPAALAGQLVFLFAIILAGALAAEVSYLFGLPVLTLGSDYFGIATLGFTIIVKVLLDNSDTMFGFAEMKGARGMVGIPKLTTWTWVFVFMVIAIVVTRNLLQSSVGRAIISVREDEIAAKAMGINVARYKTLTFVLGSLFAGVAGALYAHINGFLHPDTFNFLRSFDPMIVLVFGGLGSMTGTLVASFTWALILEGFLRLFLPQGFETWRYVVYPILLLVMMLLRPSGLMGSFEVPFLRQVMPPRKAAKADPAQAPSPDAGGD
jgi:branched-chain amino acid transport system permease protein